jgi:hypothetical protein
MIAVRKNKNEIWLLLMKESVMTENSIYPVGNIELK